MLIAYFAVVLFAGTLAAVTSLLMGFSLWSALGFYALGGSLGVGVNMLFMFLCRPRSVTEDA